MSRSVSYLYHLFSYGDEIRSTTIASDADDWLDYDAFNTVSTERITYIMIYGFTMLIREMEE
ncbi:MAG: hypothetical protein J6A19_04865 [Oscillospiraceae bacterium]|nr:hypothetical protein [Oscillospiraceae bacterium]